MEERPAVAVLGPDRKRQRRQEQVQAFHAQAGHRIDRDQFAQQAVQAERAGQAQRDPRRRPGIDGQPGHADGRHRHRHPLQPTQALLQHQHAQQYVHQRIDEVAQAGLDDVAGVDRPDVQAPVEGDSQARYQQDRQRARLRGDLLPPAQLRTEQQPAQHHHRAPDDAVGDDLERGHLVQQVPVHRHQPPDHEGGGGDQQAAALFFLVHAHFFRVLAIVNTTTPRRITAMARKSRHPKRSPFNAAPSSTAITGLTYA